MQLVRDILNLGENLRNSFGYAKKMFSEGGRLIILIVLNLIPLVNWIVVGYSCRVLRESPATDAPPKLERYGDLFVNGAKVFFASLIYTIIPTILITIGAFSLFASMFDPFYGTDFAGMGTFAFVSGEVGLALFLAGMILALIMLVILVVGIAHMIKTERFGKAFAFGEIFSIIRGIGVGRYLAWIVIVLIIAAVVGFVAGIIPFVGSIISVVLSPILSVFFFRSLGILYNDGAPPELRMTAPISVAEAVVCVSCGTPLRPHHKFCPNCGAPVPAPPSPPAVTAETKFCINCGAKIPALANFCGSCGTKQT